MRSINFFHAIAAVSCIPAFFKDWVSATITLIWIASSYFNSVSSHKRKIEIEEIEKEKISLLKKISDLETKSWEIQMKIATHNIQNKNQIR